MVRQMYDMMRLQCMRTCFSIRGGMWHMKFRGISRISSKFSYLGQCDLINIYFGLPQVWYTPGGQHV